MKYWVLSLTFSLFALICCGFAQSAASQTTEKEEQRGAEKICPTVHVSCPDNPKLGELFEFKASIGGGDPKVTPTYNWEVANGVLIDGHGTPTIRVWPVGRQGVTATLRLGGFDSICIHRTASCSTASIHAPLPPPQKIDSYGLLSFHQVRTRLDRFATVLKESPTAMGYIRVFSRQGDETGEAKNAVDAAKQYLVEKFDIDKDRIRIEEGGAKEKFLIELWLIPQGSYLPEAQQKMNPSKN